MGHPEIVINVNSQKWQAAVRRFRMRSSSSRRAALYEAGGLLIKGMRDKLKGGGHTRGARSSPYPGHGKTGNLARTMFVDVEQSGDSMRCGPHEIYAVPLEFKLPESGKSKVKKPFVLDTWNEKSKRVFEIISGKMFRNMK